MSAHQNGAMLAFPLAAEKVEHVWEVGLTKREWFAGLAMIGHLANSDPTMRPDSEERVARWSVSMADALIAELAKEQP